MGLTPYQFTGCSFGAAAIWQYESLKSRVQSYFDEVRADWLEKIRPQKQGDFRKQVWYMSGVIVHYILYGLGLILIVRYDFIAHCSNIFMYKPFVCM